MTDNGTIVPRIRYVEKILNITREEDKDSCLLFLTSKNKHLALCQGTYDDKFIQMAIEHSDYCIFYHDSSNLEGIVTFGLVKLRSKKRGKILDIALVCAVKNEERFGQMIAFSLYHFALQKHCKFLYTSPRTPELRKTFIKYGFEPIHGKEGIDEVLEKEIEDTANCRI